MSTRRRYTQDDVLYLRVLIERDRLSIRKAAAVMHMARATAQYLLRHGAPKNGGPIRAADKKFRRCAPRRCACGAMVTLWPCVACTIRACD